MSENWLLVIVVCKHWQCNPAELPYDHYWEILTFWRCVWFRLWPHNTVLKLLTSIFEPKSDLERLEQVGITFPESLWCSLPFLQNFQNFDQFRKPVVVICLWLPSNVSISWWIFTWSSKGWRKRVNNHFYQCYRKLNYFSPLPSSEAKRCSFILEIG